MSTASSPPTRLPIRNRRNRCRRAYGGGIKTHTRRPAVDTNTVDQRRDVRFDTQGHMEITVLGERERRMPGRLINTSGRGMCLATPQAIEPGAAVRIDVGPTLLLAEVAYCQTEAEEFRVGVEVEHALANTGDVARLMRSVLGEGEDAAVQRQPSQRVFTP